MILFLWVMILLSLFAVSIALRTRLATKIEGYEMNQFELSYDYLTAVNLARYFIDSDQDSNVDHPGDVWCGAPRGFKEMEFSKRFGLEITDEESKININIASEPFLINFFDLLKTKKYSLKTNSKKIAGSIIAWRGGSVAQGPSTLGTKQKMGPFESLDELLLIQSIDSEDAEKLKPFLTVYGMAYGAMKVNLNTVHRYVLEALISSLSGDASDKKRLFESIEEYRTLTANSQNTAAQDENATENSTSNIKQFFNRDDMANIAQFMVKVGLPVQLQGPYGQMGSVPNLIRQLFYYVKVNSDYFHVEVRSRLPGKESFVLETVLGARVIPRFRVTPIGVSFGQTGKMVAIPLEILSWQERVF